MKFIELFAGCGGLSLGMQSVGFSLLMANELSPMAAESYAYNFFDEDLDAQSEKKVPDFNKTLWLSSNFPRMNLSQRLRENPKSYPTIANGHSDILEDGSNLKGALIVGSIVELNHWLSKRPAVANQLRQSFGDGELDLVSGGPPCQSFSMAGLRQKDSEKNTLPWEFATFVRTVKPKLALLENVTGILRPFKDTEGNSFYAWFEIAKAFAEVGYIPLCLHVNAKLAGVPQNRPRFILLGVRSDFFKAIENTFNEAERELFAQPLNFFKKMKSGKEVGLGDLLYREVTKTPDLALYKASFLEPLVVRSGKYVSVKDAIDDLKSKVPAKSIYAESLRRTFGGVLLKRKMTNHELRTNNELVKRRFRLYQVLSLTGADVRRRIVAVLKQEAHDISDEDWAKLSKYDFLVAPKKYVRFKTKAELLKFLGDHPTKKQTQKALLADQPAPAALSIPDDACHYSPRVQRTLTVREMARIQSFPDQFVFRSKVTTGGKMRSFEVPQYTQVGNAVPPLLARALGKAISNLLKRNQ